VVGQGPDRNEKALERGAMVLADVELSVLNVVLLLVLLGLFGYAAW
jgi:hypothetical protein